MKKRNLRHLQTRHKEVDKRQQFELTKKAVLKKHPDAITQCTSGGKFYITENGKNIITDTEDGFGYLFGSVFDAWKNAAICTHAQRTINRNSKMFDLETINRKVG
jgi:hypothetical protein